ncbi:MAG: hypothetical protein AVO35_00145 [Candidatus Aegiribacteria sp. MLS_C]|nr:MAG: hypothetical protein AVO35_00145 [Candidatus Aegiribacteria sp. MLS_C]
MRKFFNLSLVLLLPQVLPADPPPGYYDPASGLTGPELQQALHDIIDGHCSITYDEVWLAFFTTDERDDSLVWDMYSDVPGGTPPYIYTLGDDQGGSASGESEGYNREHSWPKSWFGGVVLPMYTDMFQIVPTDIYVNNRRANYPYGEVESPTWVSMNGSRLGPCSWPGYTGMAFEPIDGYKGDFARNYFYMATRYLGEDAGWPGSAMAEGAVLADWAEEMLIAWHLSDPVSEKETERNDAVYEIQSNRNPFIDHPEFVLLVYDPSSLVHGGTVPTPGNVKISPNPFFETAELSFSLSCDAEVALYVFDASGRQVRTLVDAEHFSIGYHSIEWNGRDVSGREVPPGLYFLVLRTGTGTVTSRVLRI